MGYRGLKEEIRKTFLREAKRPSELYLEAYNPKEMIGPLLSLILDTDNKVRWYAITSLGIATERLSSEDMEQARNVVRKLMWRLNDESGGIGWGCPESMGEILSRSKVLCQEFSPILCSYIYEDKNFLESPELINGAIWALARLSVTYPWSVMGVRERLLDFLLPDDMLRSVYVLLALNNLDMRLSNGKHGFIFNNETQVNIYWAERFQVVRVCDISKKLRGG